MVKKTLLWTAVASVLSTAVFAMDVIVRNSVVTLDSEKEFNSTVNEHDLVLVKFFSPNCKHCIAMKEEYEQAATELHNDQVTIAELDCTRHHEICQKYKVGGYPTIQLFRKGRASDVYPHERTSDSIVKYMRKQVMFSMTSIQSTEDLEKLKKEESIVVVAYLDPENGKKIEQWRKFSDKLIDDFAFGYVTDEQLAEKEGITKFPTVVLYKNFDTQKDIFNGSFNDVEMEDFIKVNSVPNFATIRTETFMDYVDAGRPLVYVFSNSEEMKNELHEKLLPLTEKYKGKFSFVHIDANEYPTQADFLNLKRDQWPALSIHNFKTGARYPLDQTVDLKEIDKLESFLDNVHENKATPAIKSQSFVDKSNEDSVKIVVGNDFEDIVLDKTKDVFIEIYAPWCPHCRAMEPVWKQLGEVMKENNAEESNIIVAKMDGSINDVPPSAGFHIPGYPTIKFIKANTNQVVDYYGQRTLHDFVKFVTEQATSDSFKIDLATLPKTKQNKRSELAEAEGFSDRDEL